MDISNHLGHLGETVSHIGDQKDPQVDLERNELINKIAREFTPEEARARPERTWYQHIPTFSLSKSSDLSRANEQKQLLLKKYVKDLFNITPADATGVEHINTLLHPLDIKTRRYILKEMLKCAMENENPKLVRAYRHILPRDNLAHDEVEQIKRQWNKAIHPYTFNKKSFVFKADLINKLISEGANTDIKISDDYTPLLLAIATGERGVADMLISAGADVNIPDKENFTPLMWAIAKGDQNLVKILLSAGANLDLKNNLGNTALMGAIHAQEQGFARDLITAGANLTIQNNEGKTALMEAIYKGQGDIASLLISLKAGLDLQDNEGNTALMLAIKRNQVDLAQALAHAGASIHLKNNLGKTAMMLATEKGDQNLAQSLGSISERQALDHTKRLIAAVRAGQLSEVLALVSAGADVHRPDEEGRTALIYAATAGKSKIVQALLATGRANINAMDEEGETALTQAIKLKNKKIVGMLLGAHADIQMVPHLPEAKSQEDMMHMIKERRRLDKQLHEALSQGKQAEVERLLQAGAYIGHHENRSGNTPLIYAIEKGWEAVAKIFIRLCAEDDVNALDVKKNGETALMLAAKQGQAGIVKALFNEKINIDTQDPFNKTALMHAIEKGEIEVAKLLIAHGANLTLRDNNGETALLLIFRMPQHNIEEIKINLIKELVRRDPRLLEMKTPSDRTALHLAIFQNQLGILKTLLDLGIDTHAQDRRGKTALTTAVEQEQIEAVKMLIAHEFQRVGRPLTHVRIETEKLFQGSGITPLMIAAMTGELKDLKEHLQAKVPLNSQDAKGKTALMRAVEESQMEAVSMLIQHGADPSILDKAGRNIQVLQSPQGPLYLISNYKDLIPVQEEEV